MPNQKFNPTPQQRAQVRMLAARRLTLAQIGIIMGIRSPKTLRRCFAAELTQGRNVASVEVYATLYKNAVSGKHPHATISFLKRFAHWHEGMERDRIRGSGIERQQHVVNIHPLVIDRPPDRYLVELDKPAEVSDAWGLTEDDGEGER